MHRIGALLLLLFGGTALAAQAPASSPPWAAGATVRYSVRAVQQVNLDPTRRLTQQMRVEEMARRYEVSGAVAFTVLRAESEAGLELEARFEAMRVSQWFWGEDRADVERLVAGLERQPVRVSRDASGRITLAPGERAAPGRLRADLQSLLEWATLPLGEVEPAVLTPGMGWQREAPVVRYANGPDTGAEVAVHAYRYLDSPEIGGFPAALVAVESSLPLRTAPLPPPVEAVEQMGYRGLAVRGSGDWRRSALWLLGREQGGLWALEERSSLFYRLSVRNEVEFPQARIPVPLLTVRLAVEREARWLGPGDAGLVAAVAALPRLEQMVSGREAVAADATPPSLGELARELRAQRERQAAEPVPRAAATRPAAEERQLYHFPVDRAVTGPSDVVRFDPRVTRDGNGSISLAAREPVVVPLYSVGRIDLDHAHLVYQAWLRAEDIVGQAYIEMRCTFEDGSEGVAQGLAQALTGRHDWVQVETSLFLERAQKPTRVSLNVVLNGRGRVWIDDIRLLARPVR